MSKPTIIDAPWDGSDGDSSAGNQGNKREELRPVPDGKAPAYNPFDPANLRLDQGYLQQPVAKKLLTRIPVKKPASKDFIRVNSDPNYRLQLAILTTSDDTRDDVYAVMPALLDQLSGTEYKNVTLHLFINRQKVLAFWPVPLPSPDGRVNSWHETAAIAAEKAMNAWIRVMPNQSLRGYEVYQAGGPIEEPAWPLESMGELLAIAFKNGRLIDNFDHPALRTLRGEI